LPPHQEGRFGEGWLAGGWHILPVLLFRFVCWNMLPVGVFGDATG
jgi:hypothetical protein